MNVRATFASAVTTVLGSPPVASLALRRTRHRLRVVAYHGVPSGPRFAAQLAWMSRHLVPVDESCVREALAGGTPLPERAVWVTFDDGDPSVVRTGLPALRAAGVPATMYVCPGLIEAGAPPWWTIVSAAGQDGHGADVGGRHLVGAPLVTALKAVPDPERRAVVDELATVVSPSVFEAAAPTLAELDAWQEAGCALGNHTWDHPCLDACTPEEQERQIVRAHDWLVDRGATPAPSFAYPNGNHSPDAEAVLTRLGYDLVLLFDHGLVAPGASPLRTSRLRLDSDAPLGRTRAVLSGGHSAVLGLRG